MKSEGRNKARIEVSQQQWKSSELLHDFRVEDVWRLPVTLTADQDTALVRDVLLGSLDNVSQKGLVGFLFKTRLLAGKVFNWDDEPETEIVLKPNSLRERYATAEGLTAAQLPASTEGAFAPVYILEDETLDELENKTVHAGLHLGRVALNESESTVQMTVYVKPNGVFGRVYMAIIKPFRYGIVYPVWLRFIEKRWRQMTG